MKWADRDFQKVYEADLVKNYSILKIYMLEFGGKSPLEDLSHHEASKALVHQFHQDVSSSCLCMFYGALNQHVSRWR